MRATLCDNPRAVEIAAREFEKYGPLGAEAALQAAADTGECVIYGFPVYTEHGVLLGEHTYREDQAVSLGMTAFIPDFAAGTMQARQAYTLVPKERSIIEDAAPQESNEPNLEDAI